VCGIAGAVAPIGRPGMAEDLAERVQLACDALAHRGPDASHVAAQGLCVFGHRRLSIVDVGNAGSDQPMRAPYTNDLLTFNGEIYNFRELRATHLRDWPFKTGSDTEVLLALLVAYGVEKTLDLVQGMFAFAYFNAASGKIYLVRDFVGKKPLFYAFDRSGVFWFASEAKALRHVGLSLVPSKMATINFIFDRAIGFGDTTFFENVRQVAAGSYVTLSIENDALQTETTRYWTPVQPSSDLDFQAAAERFRSLLGDAIASRLPDEVPFAITLSGGLDSSSIASVAGAMADAGAIREAVNVITAVYPGDPDDESKYMNDVLKAFPNLQSIPVEIAFDDVDALFGRTILAQETPIADGSMMAHYALMEALRAQGVRVVLTGNGGDEILAGYANTFEPAGRFLQVSRFDLRGVSLSQLPALLFHGAPSAAKNRLRRELNARRGFLRERADVDLIYPRFVDHGARDIIGDYAVQSLSHWTTPGFVQYEDRNAMACSIEARSPFYDRRLIEFCLSLPGGYHINGRKTKRLLRRAMRGILPERIRTRLDKQGFHAPIGRWVDALAQRPLEDSEFLSALDYLDVKAVMSAGLIFRWRIESLYRWFKLFCA